MLPEKYAFCSKKHNSNGIMLASGLPRPHGLPTCNTVHNQARLRPHITVQRQQQQQQKRLQQQQRLQQHLQQLLFLGQAD